MASYSEVHGPERAKSMPGYSFGVRSYLHYFYEECTASVWNQEDIQNQRSYQWWSSGLCKVGTFYFVVSQRFWEIFIYACMHACTHSYTFLFPSCPGGISFSILRAVLIIGLSDVC